MVKPRPVDAIIAFLTSFPTPHQVLAFQPTPESGHRLEELLQEQSARELTPEEKQELEYFRITEHMMRMARFNAKKLLAA